ncbi:hypothetical protein COY28_05855 [Candidatus Woesearchaeota archaeon CG_4_10_14_0_2_um_filter_57_5]|nr:MAG: hypothetical protein AUJ68_03520 [Candidatus Woesearchaeota archaeon CG1_02_57_44]PIZ50027.1 MAG: hypothetical protein COY28_05855 [Candidatus Woesearchaeota archaeon CG_4_10_14_0_2_um_filter_57_5]
MWAVNMLDKIKRYYRFSPQELRELAITIVAISFIVSFNQWGDDVFSLVVGLRNLLLAILVTTLIMMVRITTQAIFALANGYDIKFRGWFMGLGIGILLAFVTKGHLWFLAPGGFLLVHIPGHRLGKFRYGVNTGDIAIVSFAGVFGALVLSLILKFMYVLMPQNEFILQALKMTLWITFWAMTPIPPLDGAGMFFAWRTSYFFFLGTFFGWAALLLYASIGVTFLGAIFLGAVFALVYYASFERAAWSK